MQNLIKQIREAREGDENMLENWMLADCGKDVEVRMAQSDIPLEESQTTLEYITLLHNNIEAILDALEEAERKAKAGAYLADKIHGHTCTSKGDRDDFWQKVQRSVKEYDTYNKTVSK